MRVHSYGAGVQSVTLLWKYLRREIERPDLVIFADTQQEPNHVYHTMNRDGLACRQNGVEFVVVSAGDLGEQKGIFIPAYTINKNGRKGTLLRQCTERFKVRPIRRELRRRGVTSGEIWLGISTDEATRMKESRVKWLSNRYPLIELGMSRADCQAYLDGIGIEASKSACVFCPYRSARNWSALTESEKQQAVDYDERLRHRKKDVLMFVHASAQPLKNALGLDEDNLNLFENECEGYCGL